MAAQSGFAYSTNMRARSNRVRTPSALRRRALEHNGGDGPVLYRSQQSVHNATECALRGRQS
jgi:hypothetical protein